MARRVRLAAFLLAVAGIACGGSKAEEGVPPETAPLPTVVLGGRIVALYPVTLVAADRQLGWSEQLGDRAAALRTADSLLAAFLTERVPEAQWVLPGALRRAARQAPGVLPDPDRMGTALLRARDLDRIPDPLRSQMRNLTAVAADRLVLVPAALTFQRMPSGNGAADLSVVIADVRFGTVLWRTIAHGEGDDAWSAMWNALRALVPDLP